MFGWRKRGTKQDQLRVKLLQDLVKAVREAGERSKELEASLLRLEGRVESAERQAQLAKECMNRVTELALVACNQGDLAEKFRAQACRQESAVDWDDGEPIEDSPMEEWPPPNCQVQDYQ